MEKSKQVSRREFLKKAGMTAALLLTTGGKTDTALAETETETKTLPDPTRSFDAALVKKTILLRMQSDVNRAIQKPLEQRRWGMAIDLRKCVGCKACTVACMSENKLPPGVIYRPVHEEEIGEYPNVVRRFLPQPCMQCANPPCVPVCPVDATSKRPDGVVETNYDKCIGAGNCVTACPYNARTIDLGESYTNNTPDPQAYEKIPNFEYGSRWPRKKGSPPIGTARKCQFCLHRLSAGMLPACTSSCVGLATYFGDLNDNKSLISEIAKSSNVMHLKEELGTKPTVFYLT